MLRDHLANLPRLGREKVSTPHLLVHLPEKGERLESSTKLIEAYRSLATERDYVWLGKPGPPLKASLRQNLEQALGNNEEVYTFLFVRLGLDARQLALYRARLLEMQGPGPNADKEHTLPEFGRRSCGTWLKLTDFSSLDAEQVRRLYDPQTGQAVPIWTDLRADCYVVHEGDPLTTLSQEPGYGYWLLCLSQTRARAEFERSWRFRPIATYQPGSAEFIAEYEAANPQRVLVYDRVFGSSTYLAVLGIYEVTELLPQGTTAGALLYTAQLREVLSFSSMPRLDPSRDEGLWGQLEVAQRPAEWDALTSKERVLLPLSEGDCQRILAWAGHRAAEMDRRSAESVGIIEEERGSLATVESELHDLAASMTELDAITAKRAQNVTDTECYHLLRTLERALREFIDRELSRVSRDWWAEGRLPRESRVCAEERKQKREHPFPWLSQQDLPAKEYLDFSDYAEIITMESNWREVFGPIFVRPEVIRGKLVELGILRNDIAHMRELKPVDKEAFIATGRQLLLAIRNRQL